MRRGRGVRAVLLGLAAVGALAFAATPTATAAPEGAQNLYVLNAGAGQLDRVGDSKRVFRLLLADPAGDVTVFTDRPVRRAGHRKLRSFIRDWNRLGFKGDPPNAAMVVADAPNSRDVLVVTLSKPRLRPGGVAFTAKVVKGSATDALRRFHKRADNRVADRFGQVSLFIDDGAPTVEVTFSLTNLPPGPGDPLHSFTGSFEEAILAPPGVPGTQVSMDGPARVVLVSNAIIVSAGGANPVSGTVETIVSTGAAKLTGSAFLPQGASGSITAGATTQPLAAGRHPFSVPLP